MNDSSQQQQSSFSHEDEVSLKDIILKFIEFSKELWKQKAWILLSYLLVAGYSYRQSSKKRVSYNSARSFMVAEDNTNELLAYNPAVIRRSERKANNKITELARSGRIIHQVLLKKVELDGKLDYLANHLIDLYGFHNRWQHESLEDEYEQLDLKEFYFTHNKISQFSQREKRALNITHELIAGNNLVSRSGLLRISYNEVTNIFSLNTNTRHKTLASKLLELVFLELEEFYIEERVGRPRRSYRYLTEQVDSLFKELTVMQRNVAYSQDQSRGLTTRVDNLYVAELKRKLDRTTNEFNSALNNKKKVEVLLSSGTPNFEIIDQTFFPIENKPEVLNSSIVGGIIGMIFGMFIIIFRKIIIDALKE